MKLDELATAMGLRVLTACDVSGGYGSRRVILAEPFCGSSVFNPLANDSQAVEVMLWRMGRPDVTREQWRATVVSEAMRGSVAVTLNGRTVGEFQAALKGTGYIDPDELRKAR